MISNCNRLNNSHPRAFGVTLWEILLMGAIPYPGISTIDLFVMLTRDHYRMPKPGNCSSVLYQVGVGMQVDFES